jgi:hypothetical protein
MSTFQHTLNSNFRTRLALLVVLAAAVAALMVVMISSSGGNASSLSFPSGSHAQPSHAQVERQLQAASGPRYGVVRPEVAAAASSTSTQSPQDQLEAVAGPRYHQPVGIGR